MDTFYKHKFTYKRLDWMLYPSKTLTVIQVFDDKLRVKRAGREIINISIGDYSREFHCLATWFKQPELVMIHSTLRGFSQNDLWIRNRINAIIPWGWRLFQKNGVCRLTRDEESKLTTSIKFAPCTSILANGDVVLPHHATDLIRAIDLAYFLKKEERIIKSRYLR